MAIEDLNFADNRESGREVSGQRPNRGKRGRLFRSLVSGIPTAKFRNRMVQMASNQGLAVIAVDPAYTSKWGGAALARSLEEDLSEFDRSPRGGRRHRQKSAWSFGKATGMV